VKEWNATITDMKFHFKNNAYGTTTIIATTDHVKKKKWKRREEKMFACGSKLV
jgi:hypothetical protein